MEAFLLARYLGHLDCKPKLVPSEELKWCHVCKIQYPYVCCTKLLCFGELVVGSKEDGFEGKALSFLMKKTNEITFLMRMDREEMLELPLLEVK